MSDDILQEALSMGFVPKEHFKGDPAKWVSPEEFVRKGKEVLPIIRKQNEKLSAEIASIRSENAQTKKLLQNAIDSLNAYHEYHKEDSKRQYERARADLIAGKKAALQDGDVDAVVRIDDAIKVLDDNQKKVDAVKPVDTNVPAQPDPTMQADLQRWVGENADWFQKDHEKTMYAMSVANFLRQTKPHLVGYAFLEAVKQEVETKFGMTKRDGGVSKVEGDTKSGTSKDNSPKTYEDLPEDAKSACDRFGERLVGKGKKFATMADWRKSYCEDYFGE